MSKLIAAGTAALGGTATAVGGSYLLKHGSGEASIQVKDDAGTGGEKDISNSSPKTAPAISFDDIDAFKNASASDIECVKSFSSGLTDLKGGSAQTINSSNKIASTFISSSDSTTTSIGCLIVNWDKKTYSGDKGNGNFKLLGTFEKGDKGFISFLIAKQKEEGKLSLTGIFYALSKDSKNNNGSIAHKKEVTNAKEIDKDNNKVENHFPKVGTDLKADVSNSDGWKMFNSDTDIQNVCVTNESTCKDGATTSSLKGYGTGKGSNATSGKSLEGWTGNLSNGGNNLFVTDEIAIPTIASEQKGTGTKVEVKEESSTNG